MGDADSSKVDAGQTGETGSLPILDVTANQLVAYNLAAFRRSAGLNQGEFGKLLGWSNATVSAAERSWDGKRIRQFDAGEVVNIAMALGVPVIALLLPPGDAGTAVRYVLVTEAGQCDMNSLLSSLAPTHGASAAARAAFEQRLLALGATGIMGPAAEEAERTRTEAADLLAKAHRQYEQIINDAQATAEALERDAETRLASRYIDPALEQADQAIADARREAGETLGFVRREADEILTKARRQSEQITGDARARAEALEHDAQERHRQAMGSLVQSREELEQRVDDLRAFERAYRTRLLAYLEGQISELKAGVSDQGPAAWNGPTRPSMPSENPDAPDTGAQDPR